MYQALSLQKSYEVELLPSLFYTGGNLGTKGGKYLAQDHTASGRDRIQTKEVSICFQSLNYAIREMPRSF